MKKKVVCMLLAATMVAGTLAGCGDKTGGDKPADKQGDTTRLLFRL